MEDERIPKPSPEAEGIINKANEMNSVEEQRKAGRWKLLSSLRVTTKSEFPEEEPAIMIDGVGAFALGDIHAVKAKQKNGKTSSLVVTVSAILNKTCHRLQGCLAEPTILWLDTEQKDADVKLIIEHTKELTGLDDDFIDKHLYLYSLRTLSFNTMISDLKLFMDELTPQVVILDGIVDFIGDFNDLATSKLLVDELLSLSTKYYAAIINVLHTNKATDDHNMRGHLGTMIAQKSGTVLECKKKDGIITVECSDSRHAPLPDWSIKFGKNGEILCADNDKMLKNQQKADEKAEKQRQAAEARYNERKEAILTLLQIRHGVEKRSEVTKLIAKKMGLSETTIKGVINKMISDGLVFYVGSNLQTDAQSKLFNSDEVGDKG